MNINNDRKMSQKHSFVHRLRDYVQGCPSDGEVSSFRKPIDVLCDHHKVNFGKSLSIIMTKEKVKVFVVLTL